MNENSNAGGTLESIPTKLTALVSKFMKTRRELSSTESEDKQKELDQELEATEREIADLQTRAVKEDEQRQKAELEKRTEIKPLVERFNVGVFVDNVIQNRSQDGIEKELITELKLQDNQIPLETLYLQQREDAVSPIPAANTTLNQQPIEAKLYPAPAADFLSVERPTVPAGTSAYPVLTTGSTAYTPAKGASVDRDPTAFSINTVTPSRIQAGVFYNIEDAAMFRGMSEALRVDLGAALGDKLDEKIVDAVIAGGKAVDATSDTKPPTFADYSKRLFEGVDGIHAATVAVFAILCAADTYARMSQVVSGDLERTVLDDYNARTRGVRVSSHVPSLVSKKFKMIYRAGSRRGLVAPIWQGVTLIPDNITKAREGQMILTAVMLYGTVFVRNDFFRIVEYQNSA